MREAEGLILEGLKKNRELRIDEATVRFKAKKMEQGYVVGIFSKNNKVEATLDLLKEYAEKMGKEVEKISSKFKNVKFEDMECYDIKPKTMFYYGYSIGFKITGLNKSEEEDFEEWFHKNKNKSLYKGSECMTNCRKSETLAAVNSEVVVNGGRFGINFYSPGIVSDGYLKAFISDCKKILKSIDSWVDEFNSL